MIMVVGLGNAGTRYARTRHNSGFMVVDELARRNGLAWKPDAKLKAQVASGTLGGTEFILIKPETMMNGSGEAVQRTMQKYRVVPSDVWVVFDDVDTPFGRARVRLGGSSSGHQGVKSVIAHCGEKFVRVKFGVSLNDRAVEPSEVYVLKPFNQMERPLVEGYVQSAADLIEQSVVRGAEDQTINL